MFKYVDVKNRLEEKTELFKLLSDVTRQEIILFFYNKNEACVSEIASQFELSRPTISHHLILMKKIGILSSTKRQKEVYYSFNKEFVIKHLEELLDLVKGCC